MQRLITLGTRGSPLALAQARSVAAALETAHGWATGTVVIRAIRTSGDKIQDRPLADVGGKALWTKELDLALLSGESDLSVHSMKDVESDRPAALVIAAMMERADVRDRLIGARSIEALPEGATVGTSSPRRAAQLLALRPDLHIEPIRGNVQTRLDKISRGEADATMLAAAGLDRLGIEEGAPVPIEAMLPAPGQAAIGIECRADDTEVRAFLSAIDHRATHRAVSIERAFTRALGGTCHSPVAALAENGADGVRLRVEILSGDGSERITEDRIVESEDDAAALGRDLLGRASAATRALFE
ncbi:hydroxymethylbilane synthase [Sphingomonas sp.]|uniref:hydroxymethylbilane synthase n=1 Tax=Sphingomonas sp. TaxID=28214 RepID=UPI00286AB726|nr:hydroxymethylbilane synthase [Sphingomonas sp.]